MIPAVAHFLWLGTALPWTHVVALRSAARRGGFERVVLHHTDSLEASPWWKEIAAIERVETRRVDAESIAASAPDVGSALVRVLRRLDAPAARANVLRAALLAREGGVYLDFDTVTVASLTPLRTSTAAFCGTERIVFPATVRRSRSPAVVAKAWARVALRESLRRLPGGWRQFRRVEGFYPTAVNNAVLGASAGHALLVDLLDRMVRMPEAASRRRYALGTHLLQDVVGDYRGADLVVVDPAVFYPLAPEISEHWFRKTAHVDLDEMLDGETRVVHWYASVRTKDVVRELDPRYVRAHASNQPFSALVLPFVE